MLLTKIRSQYNNYEWAKYLSHISLLLLSTALYYLQHIASLILPSYWSSYVQNICLIMHTESVLFASVHKPPYPPSNHIVENKYLLNKKQCAIMLVHQVQTVCMLIYAICWPFFFYSRPLLQTFMSFTTSAGIKQPQLTHPQVSKHILLLEFSTADYWLFLE